jgi:FlaA1/EpsC-like NDP-sugar epimerase
MINWSEKEVLITGGTGSLGHALTEKLLKEYNPKGIRIYSRDELKQAKMKQWLKRKKLDSKVAFIVGDVREKDRIKLACKGVDIIIHAAAMKRIEICEEHPIEAINTNVMGTENVLLAAIYNQVEKAMLISTDKAVFPYNLYGATKMCAEKIFINGNIYSGGKRPKLAVIRYGNVANSRGSVIPLFKEQAKSGKLYITNPNATRFWITLEEATKFILDSIENMEAGKVYIPEMEAFRIKDLALLFGNTYEIIGLLPGEKLHENLYNNRPESILSTSENYQTLGRTRLKEKLENL